MANDLRERAWAVFDQLADVPADQREAVLRAACGDDQALRAEVERLLAVDDRLAPAEGQAGFLQSPLVREEGKGLRDEGKTETSASVPPSSLFPPPSVGRYRVLRLLGDTGGALTEAREALRRFPKDPEALHAAGLANAAQGNRREAKQQLEGYLGQNPELESQHEVRQILEMLGLGEEGEPLDLEQE